jgi:hypothetical protein
MALINLSTERRFLNKVLCFFLINVQKCSALQQPVSLIIYALIAPSANELMVCAGWFMLKQSSDGGTAQACSSCCMLLDIGAGVAVNGRANGVQRRSTAFNGVQRRSTLLNAVQRTWANAVERST